MRCQFIHAQKAHHPVLLLCRVMRVPRSTYYAWRSRELAKREDTLKGLVLHIHRHSDGVFGSRQIRRELAQVHHKKVARSRVQRLMRLLGIQGAMPKAKPKVYASVPLANRGENLLARDFAPGAPNQRWCSDISQWKCLGGKVYVAVIQDIGSRRIVGWCIRRDQSEALVQTALSMAYCQRMPERGVIHHSDNGSQFRAKGYVKTLKAMGVKVSRSRVGNCWDNATVESWFSSLKKESLARHAKESFEACRVRIIRYIAWYNSRRYHSSLGGRTPVDYETQFTRSLTTSQAA